MVTERCGNYYPWCWRKGWESIDLEGSYIWIWKLYFDMNDIRDVYLYKKSSDCILYFFIIHLFTCGLYTLDYVLYPFLAFCPLIKMFLWKLIEYYYLTLADAAMIIAGKYSLIFFLNVEYI
jgi:hypothetical protein